MTDRTLQYPKGSIMVFTTGEYSDFGMAGFLVTIKDCDLPALAQAYDKEQIMLIRLAPMKAKC